MPVTEPLDSTVACLRLTVPNSQALNAKAADHLFKSMVPPEACHRDPGAAQSRRAASGFLPAIPHLTMHTGSGNFGAPKKRYSSLSDAFDISST